MPKPISIWPNYESWEEFGIGNGYKERNSDSLRHSEDNNESSWYTRGLRKGWIKDFNFGSIRFVEWKDFQEWKNFGIENQYEEMNSNCLRYSDNKEERSWFEKGVREEWVENFDFSIAQKNNGYWKDVSNVIEELRKNGWRELPSSRTLRDNSLSSLACTISSYHGGFPAFREKLRKYIGQDTEQDHLGSLLEEYVGGDE